MLKDNMKPENIKIEWNYDYAADSMFINEIEPYKYKESIEITDDIIVDIDEKNQVRALEILDASKVFKLKKQFVKQLSDITADIFSDDEIICIKASFTFLVHQKSTPKILNEQIANDLGINLVQTHLATA